MSQNWVLKGRLSPSETKRLSDAVEEKAALWDEPPVVSFFKTKDPTIETAEVFFAEKPDTAFIDAVVDAAGLTAWDHALEAVAEKDWVAESQKLLAPVRAGRFVIHGSHDRDTIEEGQISLEIEAGQAFGTGQHETTKACLTFIDAMESDTPDRILDLGTGSGVLAMAAAKLWPCRPIIATDIDPVAIDVAIENADLNALVRACSPGKTGLAFLAAAGTDHADIQGNAPYDLIIANILAEPLIELAPAIADIATDNAVLILAGLLAEQAGDVLHAYDQMGYQLADRIDDGDWSGLKLSPKA